MEHLTALRKSSGNDVDELELLRTHSAKRIRRIYLTDQIFDLIAWAALLGCIAVGAYWVTQL